MWVIHPSHPEAYMDNIISESGTLTESGIFIPIHESEAIKYASEVSRNVKIVSNMFDGDVKPMKLSENGRNIILQSSTGEKAVVFLEDYLQKEINSYLRKL